MILAVLLIRPLLRKAPRNITCLLWLLVALRLLLPFELKSPISLQPRLTEPVSITELAPPSTSPTQDLITDIQPEDQKPVSAPQTDTSLTLDPETVVTVLWISGSLSLLIYAAVSFTILRHRVRDAVQCSDGVWESDRIADAFLLGYWKPRIYLPVVLSRQDRNLIVAHERSHQSRGDQWWKLLGMVCLSLHWFNPLVWLGFWLMCQDIETACDEKVIRDLDLEQRKDYSLALLNSGKRTSGFLSYPVSFGEVNLKYRIKSVLSYRKPGLWVTLGAFTLAAVIAVCFMTSPEDCVHEFTSEITTEALCLEAGIKTATCKLCRYTKSEAIPATGHCYDEGVETLASTCTAQGTLTYTCKACGHTKTDAINMLEHTFGEKTVAKAPTCASEGEVCIACTVCGHSEQVEKIPRSNEHLYEDKLIHSPTCIDSGEGQKLCTLCGHSVSYSYELTEHSYSDAVVTKAATCTTKGERTYTCSVCHHIKTESISKKGHSWNDVDCTTAPTCAVCGVKGEATGHNYVYARDWTAIGRVLEEKIGTCTVCGDTKRLRGSYDLEEVQSIGTSYAKELGFITNPCPGHGTYAKITRAPYVSTMQRNGGQKALEKMLRSMIDELDLRYEDNSRYYVEVVVNYSNPYGLGEDAYFDLVVYSHLCTQGE